MAVRWPFTTGFQHVVGGFWRVARGHFISVPRRTRTEERLSCGGDVHLAWTRLQRGWYANSIVLKPMADGRVFVSLMLVRNKRFQFAEHIAVAWAIPHALACHIRTQT